MIRRTFLLSLLLMSLWGSSVCLGELSPAESRQPEYTQAQPYVLLISALELRAKQTGDLHRHSDLLAPDRMFASPRWANAPVGGIVRAIDPPIHTHLVARQLTASGL